MANRQWRWLAGDSGVGLLLMWLKGTNRKKNPIESSDWKVEKRNPPTLAILAGARRARELGKPWYRY